MMWENSEYEEQAHLLFMVSHHSNIDDDEVSNDKPSYDELHDAFNDLRYECFKISKLGLS